jgi:hypothetical protein
MSFPAYSSSGYYILSDSTKIKGKQAAIEAQERLTPTKAVPEGYRGPVCPRAGCGSANIRALRSHEFKGIGGKGTLPKLYACHACGKRWEEAA